jgi:hypothetical protein
MYADLSGFGAAMFPGRSERNYTTTSHSLALAEQLVHLPKNSRPQDYLIMIITLQPCDAVHRKTAKDAVKWFEAIGRVLSENTDDPIAFIAPSVVIPEYNVVLYPRL